MSASQKFMGVVKGLILSYLLTIIMLFITAVVVYKVGISDKVLGILVVVIYIVATFAGGFVTGRKVREKRFLWGMVYGLTYISVALTVSVLFTGSGDREGIAVITKCIM
ncbi:MAG: TIGR04086 family membrane protein, partial [Coprococcus sp.]